MSLHFNNVQTSDRGCVGDQPQKRPNANCVKLGSASRDSDLLRLVSDPAEVQFLIPAPAK
jgi:hypothetical protein